MCERAPSRALSLAGFEVDAFASAERARPPITFGMPAIVVCDVLACPA
ncbi:MAG: hypothetical protein ACXWCE_01715 [Caldimonas sp.]